MRPELRRFGNDQSPVVVIDEFSGQLDEILQIASALGSYPEAAGNYYPGVRRIVGEQDEQAYSYVMTCCERAAPFIGGAFDIQSFDLTEASFSIVTTLPSNLSAAQRAPHFDSPEPNIFAILHYLRVPESSGTAFFRHRSTGIERVTKDNLARFVAEARNDAARLSSDSGYISGSNQHFEQIGKIEAVPDRLIIYQGCLLHSGIIPPGMMFSTDPQEGRLTANLFIRGIQDN